MRTPMRRSATFAMTAAVLLAAGCGGNDSSAPSTTAKTTGASQASYPRDGVAFTAPAGWSLDQGRGHLVATVQTGQATVAVWRYKRSAKLPRSTAELKAARDALLTASAKRDDTFEVIKSAPTEIAGKPAVQIRARETIDGRSRTVRSTHIYSHGSEYVIDAYADADGFRRVDAQIFRPLLRSLQVTKPQTSG
jgi:hypothetical protein